jgi:mono/diheme cytochrome c family protein
MMRKPRNNNLAQRPRVRRAVLLAAALLTFLAAGCYRRSDMDLQPKFWKVYRPSEFFADAQSARPLPEGVVPVEYLRTNREFFFAKDSKGQLIDHLPSVYPDGLHPSPTADGLAAVLDRGRQRYDIYCIVCHGPLGYGDGMIVQRGFPSPPSFHSDKLLHHEPLGHFYDVITNGYGAMFSYAERVAPVDRWAIATYIKALQVSQNPTPQQENEARTLAPEVNPDAAPATSGGTP